MTKRKHIAVFMADLQSEYNRKTMEGIIKQANAVNYDIMAYSMFSNHDNDSAFQRGEENIFELFNPDKADGIIIYKESFRKDKLRERIIDICIASGLPYIEMDKFDSDSELKIWNDREIFCRLVSHMIEEHSLKRIYCLTGFKNCHQSQNRLEGYRDAMRIHGIPFRSEWEFYGDFWKESAEKLAEAISTGNIEKPEAVVCANGGMAVNLTNALIERGIGVPSEIAVAGYDSFTSNALNEPTVTAMSDINYNQGITSVCLLHKKITGELCTPYDLHIETVEPGGSCGCGEADSALFKWYKKELSEQLIYVDLFQSSNMMQKLSGLENLKDFAEVLSRFTYLIRGLKELYICICDDWDGINKAEKGGYRVKGYSENVLMFHLTGNEGYRIMSLNEAISDICGGKNPSAYYFIPLHFEDRRFGFAAAEFCDGQFSFDKQFWTWTDNVSIAIETIRIRNYIRRFSERIHLTAVRDPLTGIYNRRGFEELSYEIYEQAIINKEKFMMIVININNLRSINHELGCSYGDDIVITVADAVNSSCRGNEVCCRCGDDNFYIIGSMNYKNGAAAEHIESIKKYCLTKSSLIEGGVNIILDTGYFCQEVTDGTALSDIINNLGKIIENKRIKRKRTYLKNFSDLRKQIYEDPRKKWNVDEMAQSMALSRAYFQRLYKREYGISVMKDVITARIALARKLLDTDKSSITAIAAMCGYESEIYFMQQFKKETGMTPTQYRKGGY